MSAAEAHVRTRLLELMADRATEGLREDDERELARLLAASPVADPLALELTAAALDLALAPGSAEPMPDALRARVEADALAFQSGRRPARVAAPPAPARRAPRRARPRWPWAGIAVAGWTAAGMLWLALAQRVEAPAPPPASLRAELLADAPDVVTADWSPTGDPAAPEARGDVVWSPSRQQGYMRFRGLAPNDPAVSQYQLWIFDADRNEAYPVDGGVFDVARGEDEVVVPIHAHLPVGRVVLFAVTVERPGGVVVSTRERLPLLARVGD